MHPVELIPDQDFLFYRVHKMYVVDGEIIPGVFREIGAGMSTDWDKYSTPQVSLSRCRIPHDNMIVSGNVGRVRKIPLEVTHAPSRNNRAHTNVTGLNEKARLLLLDIFDSIVAKGQNI